MYAVPFFDFFVFACSDSAAGGDAAFIEGSVPPQAAHEHVEEPLKVNEEMSVQQLMEELGAAVERQAELVTQLKARYVGEGSSICQKDEEIALLRAQLADARADVESTSAYARRLTDEKLSLMAEVRRERAETDRHRANCSWGLKYLQENRAQHFANLDELRERVEEALKVQESKLRKLSIKYDEELYPHLVSAVAERRYSTLHFFFNACIVIFIGG